MVAATCGVRHALADAHQRRNRGRRARHFLAVTDGALIQVERLGSVLRGVFGERAGPGHIVGIDVENAGLGIGGRAAPLRAAIESGKDDRIFADAEGDELAFAAKAAEFFERPLMGFGRAVAQKILGQKLPREGRRLRGQALLLRGDFSGNIAGRIVAAVDGKQRRAVRAVEKKYEALLGGLRDCVDFLAVALHGEEHGRRGKVAIPYIVACTP